jgi:hypothetical protein
LAVVIGISRFRDRMVIGGSILLSLIGATALRSQETARGPVLLLQPGMASADFLSAPQGEPSTTGFNLRVAALVYTSRRWITPILGASVTPYGSSGASRRNTNTPVLFVGNVFPVISRSRTAGWASFDVPVLLTYTFGGGGAGNPRIYGRDLAVQTALTLHAGRKLLSDFGGALARLQVYAIAEQTLTPNRRTPDRPIDRFNPVVYYGLTIPVGSERDP